MKRKKALKKQLKRLMKISKHCALLREQIMVTNAILPVVREMRKGKIK